MTEVPASPADEADVPPGVDPTVAHPARVYDYILGGTNYYASDRQLGDMMAAAAGGLDRLRTFARSNRDLLARVVRFLVHEGGIRQFLDIGTGVPAEDNVHGVAQAEAPDTKIVYVDSDPIVVAHAETLLASTSEGATAFIRGDLLDPEGILLRAEATLDFDQPVAILLMGVLHMIADDAGPHGALARLLDAVPSGSYLALSHMATDVEEEMMAEFMKSGEKVNQPLPFDFAGRGRDGVAGFLDGLEVVPPGIVLSDQWRTDLGTIPERGIVPLYAVVGRKP